MAEAQVLDFEKSIVDVEKRIAELRDLSVDGSSSESEELKKLNKKLDKLKADVYSKLTPWQVTRVARHPARPYSLDYIEKIFDEFVELHGDRTFGDDHAIVGGLATLGERRIVVIGQQKGRTMKERQYRNFGMPSPEGYRKALRLMHMAERFDMPVITLIDTPGAYPGVGAEERGQAEAIARNLQEMSTLKTPIISVVIGEGGSGGALALGMGDTVMMLEFATYSVISPEGCAAILWKDASKMETAAKNLKITAKELLELSIIDRMVKEPLGGAHRDPDEAARNLKDELLSALSDLKGKPIEALLDSRYEKYRSMGAFSEPSKG